MRNKTIVPLQTEPAKPEKKPSVYDAAQTAEVREKTIRTAISVNFNRVLEAPVKTDLHNLPDVKRAAQKYISSCSDNAIMPSFEGLCACLGITRKWAYEFLKKHSGEPSAEFLESLKLSMAATRMSLAEAKVLDNAVSIFILKNSGIGFTDKLAIEEPEHENPMSDLDPIGARERLLAAIPDD